MTLMIFGNEKYKDTINKGVYINNIDVGNMTKQQAVEYLNKKVNDQFKDYKISARYNNREFYIEFSTLKAHYDIESAVDKAFEYNKNANLTARILQNMGVKKVNHNEMINFVSDSSPVDEFVKKIAKKLDYEPIDAKLFYENNSFRITKDEKGLKIDTKQLAEKIKAAIRPDWDESVIEITATEVKAKATEELLSHVKEEIISFSTHFSTKDANRTSNIRTAAKSVDGKVLLPDETFSMNKALGELDAKNGYKEAHVIVNGELTTGMAGGICQVTTTVYNVALLSNMDIVSRRGHSLKVAYVDPGRDATVSGSYIDFKFKNTNSFPVYIHTSVKGGTLTVQLFGENEHPGQSVEIESKVLEKIQPSEPQYIYDSSLVVGTRITEAKAITGYRSVTYRKIFQDGKLIKTELLSKDRYKAVRAKIRVGTKM
jgi:vancomycin resistance protein YoaR